MSFQMVNFFEQRPHWGILGSALGFTTSLIAWIQQASVIIGFVGAVFGLLAGFYTWRIKRHQWKREQDKK